MGQGLRPHVFFGCGDCRTRRHTESALDAVRELDIVQQLLFGLEKFSGRRILLRCILSDQVRLDRTVLSEQPFQVRDQIPDYVVVGQRLDDNAIGVQVDNLVIAGKPGQAVDKHAARPAYSHAA